MKKIARFLLRLLGWNVDNNVPHGVKKCVVVMGPHTSNMDFLIGKLAFVSYGLPVRFLIKKEAFVFGIGWLLKAMGGIPVDRKKNNNLTDYAVSLFDQYESLYLVFTPEGTRKYNPKWKKGFYYIAEKAKVPIYIGFMDYEKKIGGFHSLFHPTGDVDKDIAHIKKVLSAYKGKHPEHGIY